MPIVFACLIIAGIFIGAKLTPVHRMFSGQMSANIYNYNKIQDILYLIEREYVDEVDRNRLVDMAIKGMIKQLDPHSVFITAEEMKAVRDELSGNFEGIGVQFSIWRDTIIVLGVIKNGPAENAGIKAGDRIIEVDTINVAGVGVSNEKTMSMLKGLKGTDVNVGIMRYGFDDIIRFQIIRDVIPTPSLDVAYMVNDKTGYIKINTFAENTYIEFMQGLRKLNRRGMNNLVLDLRGNAGGLLDQAVKLANQFLERHDPIVFTKRKSGKGRRFLANGKGSFKTGGLVILIDELSASASEIIAGAVQDNDRGFIVGRRSFGKGLVQQQVMLADGSALRLTTERYYTPAGRSIQKPYAESQEEYFAELLERIIRGDDGLDTAGIDDSLIFKTLKENRTVYGGGGIMPDYVVSRKEKIFYDHAVSTLNAITPFATDMVAAKGNKILNRYNNEGYIKNFNVGKRTLDSFYRYANISRNRSSDNQIKDIDRYIKHLIKAHIGRVLYGEEVFYRIINKKDEMVKKGISLFN